MPKHPLQGRTPKSAHATNLIPDTLKPYKQQTNNLKTLQKISHALTKTINLHEVAQTITDIIEDNILLPDEFTFASLRLVNEKEQCLEPIAVRQNDVFIQKLDQEGIRKVPVLENKYSLIEKKKTAFIRAYETGKPTYAKNMIDLLVPHITKREALAIQKARKSTFSYVIPLKTRNKILGMLTLIMSIPRRQFSKEKRKMLLSVAADAAVSIENALLYEKTQEQVEELRIANRQLAQYDDAKTEFLSIASHELQSPLTVALIYLDRIKKIKEETQQNEYINKAQRTIARMKTLIEDFLNISEIESGEVKLHRTNTAIHKIIKQVLEEHAFELKKRKLRIELTGDKHISPLFLDKKRIYQVISNLVDNAIKYGASDTKIVVHTVKTPRQIKVSITDFGIGIDTLVHKDIFQKFYRAENIKKVVINRTGIGLYICKKFIEAHQGKIGVKSKSGKGSTFWFTLPSRRFFS